MSKENCSEAFDSLKDSIRYINNQKTSGGECYAQFDLFHPDIEEAPLSYLSKLNEYVFKKHIFQNYGSAYGTSNTGNLIYYSTI